MNHACIVFHVVNWNASYGCCRLEYQDYELKLLLFYLNELYVWGATGHLYFTYCNMQVDLCNIERALWALKKDERAEAIDRIGILNLYEGVPYLKVL